MHSAKREERGQKGLRYLSHLPENQCDLSTSKSLNMYIHKRTSYIINRYKKNQARVFIYVRLCLTTLHCFWCVNQLDIATLRQLLKLRMDSIVAVRSLRLVRV